MKSKLPDCPKCKSNRRVYEEGHRNLQCTTCGTIFDNDPDEGGDHSTDPTRRMRQIEERDVRRKQRQRPRSNRRSGRFGVAGRKGHGYF